MKNFVFCFLILTFITLSFNCQKSQQHKTQHISTNRSSVEQPQIQILDSIINFGTITQGEEILCYFRIKNLGPGTLEIKSIEPDCGCTIVNLNKKRYKPGDTALIQAKFDSWGYQGIQYKNITIKTNSVTPEITLTFFGTVK